MNRPATRAFVLFAPVLKAPPLVRNEDASTTSSSPAVKHRVADRPEHLLRAVAFTLVQSGLCVTSRALHLMPKESQGPND
jgi:hypothetical protein